ncbi:hypothetical protein ACF0H5_018079 [Mactra antiquata]
MSRYLMEDSSGGLPAISQETRPSNNSVLDKKTDFNILEKLKYLRDNRKYCDVVLEVRGVKFVAHKNVLASWSPVLGNKLFSEDPEVYKDYIIVYYDNSEVFSDLLDFMYNGYVAPRETNFLQLLHLAVSFQIETLKEYCEEFLRCNLHLGNFVSTYFLSRKFKLETLEEYIVGFLQLNLSDAVKQGEFLSLSAEKFNTFLSEGWMKKIKPEIKLFLIISWVGYDVQEREKYLVVLLGHIDWSTVANDFLQEINRTENFFTTHESSLYLLLQTLYSAGISLGPYKGVFPYLRENHSSILKEVVHTSMLKIDAESFNPVTITVKSRPLYKDSSVNTNSSLLPCNLKESAINTDVNSLHFEESEKEIITVEEQPMNIMEEEPSPPANINDNNKFETLGEFIEAEIKEMNQKLTKEQTEDFITEDVQLKQPEKVEKKKPPQKSPRRRSGRQTKSSGYYKELNEGDKSAIDELDQLPSIGSTDIIDPPLTDVGTVPKISINVKVEENIEVPTGESDINNSDDETGNNKQLSTTKGRTGSKTKSRRKKQNSSTDEKLLACEFEDCAYMTKIKQRMDKHVRCAHEATFDLHCNLCQFETKECRKFNKHMKQHFAGPPFSCDYPKCTYKSEKMQPLLTHRAKHSDDRPFTCHCGMRFRTNNTLIAHKKVHSGKKEYTCTECGVSFATKNTLTQHKAVHSDTRPYLCDTCGFSTKFQSHLIAHRRLHTGNVFNCQFPNCGYFTPKRSQLKAHMRAHLGIRAYICNTCGKAFVEKSHLIRHEALHSDVRLQCDQCDYNTPRKDKLKDHIKKHHTDDGTSPKNKKKAKMINTTANNNNNNNKNEKKTKKAGDRLEVTAPLLVKWDHGGYSRYEISHGQEENGDQRDAENNVPTMINTDNEYCVLRDQMDTSEPIQQILTMGQINNTAVTSVTKEIEPETIVGQVSSNIIDSDNSAVRVISSSVPCLNLVQAPVQLDQVVVNSSNMTSSFNTDTTQTYTIIQSSTPGTIQSEYGGLGAFMALF